MKMNATVDSHASEIKAPPVRSTRILTDIKYFLLNKPAVPTLIDFPDASERENFSYRIIQRLGVSVTKYSILNIHKIGIDAPVRYVFEELMNWDGDSTCWPNHIATVERVAGRLEHIRIFLFGRRKMPAGFKKIGSALNVIPLFDLNARKVHDTPDSTEPDNARYLLYRCSGGYPIGFFSIYIRSSIRDQGEIEPTQMFMVVGFNFYGREEWSKTRIINRIWEKIHNRVSTNVMNRFKQYCEWQFQKLQDGLEGRSN